MNNLKKVQDINDLLNLLKNEAETNLLTEICGLISFKNNSFIYKRMINISSERNFFKINPKEYLDFVRDNNCFCIFHSHISGDEKPSEIDILNSDNCCKAFLIYSVVSEKFYLYEPHNKDYDVNIINLINSNL